jgi:hypothetical protein
MNLHHSGDINEDPKSSAFDYGDTTCIMGFGDGKDDTRKCFNGAKVKIQAVKVMQFLSNIL